VDFRFDLARGGNAFETGLQEDEVRDVLSSDR